MFVAPEKVAVHVCCGPCAIEPTRVLIEQGWEPTYLYHNPNIHPVAEYEARREVAKNYASNQGIAWVELDYNPALWIQAVASHCDAASSGGRCRACYEARLTPVVKWAKEQGYQGFATTLTVSPYQDQSVLADVAQTIADTYGVPYVGSDYSNFYGEATRISRELGMYRQNYCGCLLSDIEAREQRAARRRKKPTQNADPSISIG